MTRSPRPVAPDRLARLHHAVDQVLQSVGFPPGAFDARQTPPDNAKARQTTPPTPFVQNKPTGHNDTSAAGRPTSSTRQSAPNHANARPQSPVCKTNPAPPAPSSILQSPSSRRPPRPLTPNQLRAATLLVAGHSTTAIAATLSINRHTLAAWKTKPLFQLELRRILQSNQPSPIPVGPCVGGATRCTGRCVGVTDWHDRCG
jgi:DNA-binding CsgD family transcriptional regulator